MHNIDSEAAGSSVITTTSTRMEPGNDPSLDRVSSGGESNFCNLSRRPSCHEMDSILEKVRLLNVTDLDLPKNEGVTIDCHLLKEIGREDIEKVIDATFDGAEKWLKKARRALMDHVKSHCFSKAEDNPDILRTDKIALEKRHDSGVCSKELPPNILNPESDEDNQHQIEELKDDQAWVCQENTRESGKKQSFEFGSDDREEVTSFDCNVCENSHRDCICKNQRRPEPAKKKGKRRHAIASSSQVPNRITQTEDAELPNNQNQADDKQFQPFKKCDIIQPSQESTENDNPQLLKELTKSENPRSRPNENPANAITDIPDALFTTGKTLSDAVTQTDDSSVSDAAAQTDAAQTDAAQTDAAQTDAAQTDAAQTDAAQTDAAQTDGAQTDAAQTDAAQTTSNNDCVLDQYGSD